MPKHIIIIIAIVGTTLIILKIIGIIYNKFFSIQKQLHIKFFKNFIQVLIVIFAVYNIFNQFDSFQSFSTTILTSSSLLVVVLGFAFQTSLEDFIAGILISIFKPFNIDDRIYLTKSNISGTIENITIRHTIIKTFNNSRLIIPNSIMNKEIVENSHIIDTRSGNFLDVVISYESDLAKAKEIITDIIKNHPKTIDMRSEVDVLLGKPAIIVYIRELGENGIHLRSTVWTENVDDNFLACSEIREKIIKEFAKNEIEIPYPHICVGGHSKFHL